MCARSPWSRATSPEAPGPTCAAAASGSAAASAVRLPGHLDALSDLTMVQGHAPADTDLAWTRMTPWRSTPAAVVDQAPVEVTSAAVEAEADNPSAEPPARWPGRHCRAGGDGRTSGHPRTVRSSSTGPRARRRPRRSERRVPLPAADGTDRPCSPVGIVPKPEGPGSAGACWPSRRARPVPPTGLSPAPRGTRRSGAGRWQPYDRGTHHVGESSDRCSASRGKPTLARRDRSASPTAWAPVARGPADDSPDRPLCLPGTGAGPGRTVAASDVDRRDVPPRCP